MSVKAPEEQRERCADLLDLSGQMSEAFLDANVKTVRNKLAPETHLDFDGVNCVEANCGVPLPKARLDMGRIRCVDCQGLIEQRASR